MRPRSFVILFVIGIPAVVAALMTLWPREVGQRSSFTGGAPGFVPGGAGGDITGVTAGSGLTGGATNGNATIALNIAGATCTNGRAVTAINSVGTGTCGDTAANQYGQTHFEWNEEYTMSPTATTQYIGPYSSVVAGGGYNSNSGTTTRPGLWQASTSTNTTGRVTVQTSQAMIDFGSGTWSQSFTGGFPALSSATDEFHFIGGFFDSTTVDQTDGCYFLYDRGNTAVGGPNTGNLDVWSCWCASNSVRTTYLINGVGNSDESFPLGNGTIGVLTLPNTNIATLEVRMTGNTRAEFFINNVKVCNINTNIPSGSARLTGAGWQLAKSVGTGARTVIVDRSRLVGDLNAVRSP